MPGLLQGMDACTTTCREQIGHTCMLVSSKDMQKPFFSCMADVG